ncbi:MAG: leader peptidase (prepilin peptidase) / N-methyltransferase [Parcubacteria group bacterium Gr01-1014_18]|nr:MAG: leader peptidase (prepilin peptidase) / N-methyltransferase [Parcubacteria group bacterium Greene0416_36]TSC80863.1 MAG: leader peptidase (prepilin peptidase) / N-methyltransferase [Parcubacteria group bacterium Gr01-1014_18]TSC99524.1 MAG: leader peptidase (prepilin peptidase) / N-methyltransferase [Parcubacteria group bacterium Greene1014_20]TSD07557.1 MAG: leader peptidase (prepilin peptidase) / N-methyltransferase [Parcubacteria group bacterium Greene0714_2]
MGRSMCPECHHYLGILDLIPLVSFFFLRGRCRYCQKKIALEYFGVELVCGILAFLFSLRYLDGMLGAGMEGPLLFLMRDLLALGVLVFIFLYDLKYYLILDKITLPSIVFFFFVNIFLGFSWGDLLLGAAIAGGFFALQFIISRGRWIGGGDIRMGVLMGVMLGWKGTLVALALSYWTGALFGILLIALGKKQLSSAVPFGTFLSAATIMVLLWESRFLELWGQFIAG